MNCFVHATVPARGVCSICGKAVCTECIASESPRLVCAGCEQRGALLGYEYRSAARFGSWPLVHVCMGVDARTMRPKVARGVIAIGNIAVGGVAVGGLAVGLVSLGGLSLGALVAVGGAALGLGLSFGGLAVGAVAVGGGAIGYMYAMGGGAFAPAVIDAQHCDEAARTLFVRLLGRGALPPHCL
ncbi:MAG: hypothetical protein L0Y66_15290 [Myxococcaceae bacterium]|nr:hypothetical protein [Myxococcaceae bacterium]MCI0670492.1 hypothetical protein [Myxococcaceae bacterium]